MTFFSPASAFRPARLVRSALLASALALSGFAAGPAAAQEIRAVMHSGIRVLDPVITTAHITRNHGYMIYDTLLGMDENLKPQPQMASWTVSDDQLTYTFTLRDGLKWTDGQPVTSADAIASLKRWGERDGGAQMLFKYVESLEAEGDKTLVMKLSQPFSYAIELMAKPSGLPTFIMPERVAKTPSSEAITDYTGSGPFKFVEAEFEPGVRAVYEKNADYVPREEPASWTAGGKVVKVDKVTWVVMPDAQTAVNAINSGEIDFLEQTPIDLLPLLSANPDLTVKTLGKYGYQTMARLNWLNPPFDNVKIRRAALTALGQQPILAALVGNPDYMKVCGTMYGCDTPYATEAGAEPILNGPQPEKAKEMLKEAGYDGTPIVLMQPTDVASLAAQPVVAAQLLRQGGFTVDMQPMDWQTLVTRRASQAGVKDGGWNLFFTNWIVPEVWSPINNPMLNGGGKSAAWFGWPDDTKLEEMRVKFASATSEDERKTIAADIQAHAYEVVNYIPVGEYLIPATISNTLEGMLEMPVPVFWSVTKSE
ncbi:ABC transporter substrate-binding protein [Aurantimonas sp. 22II-16-19i]|uniref:ABC transporter substrate-binding protein n=1 Tax=Aurantimonas sp. 22II-16-19i TaxID=1317114 RepID=UPI0009F8016C|nr:ABC transporter substrate-binding protein [Aurantimonas sp. 22II-16-19i]ORE98521.1 ABC transporter substrate-binding protein [Aurantimonas sp. 22II-16-19i]